MSIRTAYEHGQFSWVDLMAQDIAGAKEFYGTLFGWTPVDQDTQGGPPYVIFQRDGRDVAGMGQMTDEMQSQGLPAAWNSYINVDDLENVLGRVEELGGRVYMPAMQVLDAGWLAGIQDPTGGSVFLWQKNRHFGAAQVDAPGSFCWNELATHDVEQARKFYEQLLGWVFEEDVQSSSTYYVVYNRGAMNGGLLQMTAEQSEIPPHWTVYFAVEDADATAAQVRKLGGQVHCEPYDLPVGRMAVVGDAQGAVFHVIRLNAPPA